ncbi:6-phosphogluconate dehydrogenase [Bacillus sp. JCM 19047]|nr:6-phosphogluconate dehydrogenase [Bacillus sp. JCM 19047]
MTKQNIGVIGVGVMGRSLALTLKVKGIVFLYTMFPKNE